MTKLTRQTERGMMLREPAQQIWFAGLGAFAMAEEEGSKLFKTLVRKGKSVERHAVMPRFETVKARVDEVRALPGMAIEKIGTNMDESVTAVLHRLGVPTKREIGTLARRVEELTRTIETRQAKPRRTRTTRVTATTTTTRRTRKPKTVTVETTA
jgi:poly(hydroxyalkanoate) granule-associated protein